MRRARIGLLIALAAPALACGEEAAAPVAGEELLGMRSDQVVVGFRHRMTTDALERAVVVGDTAYLTRDSMEIARPRMEFFDENGVQSGDLVAVRGFLNPRTQHMTAVGDVVLNIREGNRRIETEKLHFDPQANRMWSDVATVYREGSTVLRGTGFTSDGKNFRVLNPRGSGLKLVL